MSGNIHIKFESSEANDLKKNALIIEKELLESVGHLKEYGTLRKREFMVKLQVKKDVAKLVEMISDMETLLPKEAKEALRKESPQKLNKAPTIDQEIAIKKKIKERRKSDIENEIDEIRKKLSMLE